MRFKHVVLLPLALLVMLGAGCGQTTSDTVSNTASDAATSAVINAGLKGEGHVDVDQGTVNYQGKNGETMRYGDNVQLPEDFPQDVKVYPQAKIMIVNNSTDGASLTAQTPDALDVTTHWYEEQYADWTKSTSTSSAGYEMRVFENDLVQITVMISNSDNVTTVTMARTKKSS